MTFTIVQLVAITLLLVAVGDHPYDYYKFMRFVVCAVSACAAYYAHESDRKIWVWVYLTIAVLFNPFATVHLDRERWAPIDIGTAVVMLVGIVMARKTKPPSDQTAPIETSATPAAKQITHSPHMERSEYESFRFDLRRLHKRAIALGVEGDRLGGELEVAANPEFEGLAEPVYEPAFVENFMRDFEKFVFGTEELFDKLSRNDSSLLFLDSDYDKEKKRRMETGETTLESSGMVRHEE